MTMQNYKKDQMFTVSLQMVDEFVPVDVYIKLERHGQRFQSVGHICCNGKHCGMFRHWLHMPCPAWYPDPNANGIKGSWNKRHDTLNTYGDKPDSLGRAILKAEQLLVARLNFGLFFNRLLSAPVYKWTKADFENIGVDNSGFLERILKAVEAEKPQKLRELVNLKCGFGPKSYQKAVEKLGRLEHNMRFKCFALK